MIRFKKSKKILAAILTAGMLLAGNGVPICAAEPVSVAQTEEQLNYPGRRKSGCMYTGKPVCSGGCRRWNGEAFGCGFDLRQCGDWYFL